MTMWVIFFGIAGFCYLLNRIQKLERTMGGVIYRELRSSPDRPGYQQINGYYQS